jgi:VanZ family protein
MTRAGAPDGVRAAWRVAPTPIDALVLAVVAGIVYASLVRHGGLDCRGFGANLLREWRGSLSGKDLFANVFAYLLLGAAIGFAWLARRPGGRTSLGAALAAGAVATLAGAALSLSMEAAQACLRDRHSTLPDVVANTAGTALGWLAARLVHPIWRAMRRDEPGGHGEGRLAAVVALATLAWTIAETGPWLPAGGTAVVRHNVQAAWTALGAGLLDPWQLVRHGGAWLVVGLALTLPLHRPALAVLPFCALAATVIVWRFLLPIGHAPSSAALATLPLAALLVLTVPMLGRRACAALLLAAAAAALLAYPLQPDHGAAQPFAWRILMLSGDPIAGIRLACGFAWVAAAIVAAGYAIDGRRLRWVGLAVALLAASEWAQTGLPGRTPDLSPIATGLAAAALAAGMLARRHPPV